MILGDTASRRVEISQMEREAREILQKMSARGISVELLGLYEQLDTKILRLRMELVGELRRVLADSSTKLYD